MHPVVADYSTEQITRWDHAHSWHPFTQMREWLAEESLVIERAEGNYLYDTEGNRYFDGVSSLWCNVHGHGRREIVEAIQRQAATVAHTTMLGLANVPATLLAKRLIEITPRGSGPSGQSSVANHESRVPSRELTRVFYSDAGATAVEIALKMAFQYWQLRNEPARDLFVTLAESYHGDTIGAVSLGYSELFHRWHRALTFPCLKLNPPHVYRYYRGETAGDALRHALEEAEHVLTRDRKRISALIVEPLMQGAAGMWSQPVEYVTGLHRLCRDNNILFIADEVAVGFGRTGKMFACEHSGISPDLLCLGKGISGGTLPLAATLATEEIFQAFLGEYEERKTFFHGHTYTGNPVACAAALASLDLFERDRVLERLQPLICILQELLAPLAAMPSIADIRQWGLMAGIEIVQDAAARRSFPASKRIGKRVILEARRRGVILRPLGDVIVLMPPLSTSADELRTLASVVSGSIQTVLAEEGVRL